MNISCRIANADTQCGRITNPPERRCFLKFSEINRTLDLTLIRVYIIKE